ncbi:MAG: ROK family transcriptional regulator [Chloroflexi bacterium]|nr:ROK family transcriptional regulator [Chloroflexota bacterium]
MNATPVRAENNKDLNQRIVLNEIRQRVGVSRSELVHLTGLSKATVSTIVNELIETGLVQEVGSHNPSIGRPRISLSLVRDANFVIGVELTEEECRVVLTNLYAEPVKRVWRPVVSTDLSVPTLLLLLDQCIAELMAGVDATRVLALGVCVPGIVDSAVGMVMASVLLPWQKVHLADALRQRYPYPVAVFSRGNAATWGERWYGAGRDVSNLLYGRVGSGIVAGLVIHGQPYLGHNFGAGELGHVTVQPDGALCRCGNRGCLATVATTGALLNRVRQLLRENVDNPLWQAWQPNFDHLTLADVVAAADDGNGIAIQAFVEIGRWLGLALASVLNLLNLDMIIIGGPMALAGQHLFTPLKNELAQRTLPTHLVKTQIVPSTLKEDAPAVGAASLVLHEFMSPIRRSVIPGLASSRINLFT